MHSGCRPTLTSIAACIVAAALLAIPRGAPANDDKLDQKIDQLIDQLGSDDYLTREQAERRLLRLGFEAFDALRAAEEHDDIEIANQARYLARRINVDWTHTEDSAQVKTILRGYEDLPEESDGLEDSRLIRAEKLASLPGDECLVPLCRLVRFESSRLVAKRVAMLLLAEPRLADKALWKRWADTIHTNLGRSERVSARWLRARLLSLEDPEAALAEWTELIELEKATSDASTADSQSRFVLALIRRKAELLQELGRRDEALAEMLEMVRIAELAKDPETVADLVVWLAKQAAWDLVDQIPKRFDDLVEKHPTLLYSLAQARSLQDNDALAQELADRALKLNAQQVLQLEPRRPLGHIQVAHWLAQRGLYDWAVEEYRSVIKLRDTSSPPSLVASIYLSELYHDGAQELAAGEALREVVQIMDRGEAHERMVMAIRRDPAGVRSRADYFLAMHFAAQNDLAKHKEHLEKAIRHDPTDADVLIAMYRLEDADEAYRARTLKMIRQAAQMFRAQIKANPEMSTPYNQFAWLIGNTEGDYDEAIRCSHTSLEITPGAAGYLDTLGRCYYAKGDYASAVKYQQQAAELEPHTRVIGRQLEFFRQALQASNRRER